MLAIERRVGLRWLDSILITEEVQARTLRESLGELG